MNYSLSKKAAAATLGVVTVISFGIASTPALAKGQGSNGGNSSHSLVQQVHKSGKALRLGVAVEQGNEHGISVKTASLPFTVTNLPAIISNPSQLASKLVFKVIPLPADATEAPATPPALSREQKKFDGKFGFSADNQSTLTIVDSTLSGAIKIRGLKSGAGVQNFAVYAYLAADNRSGLEAQASTPVFVTATTASDGTVTLSGQSGELTLDLSLNTGTIKTQPTATVIVPDDGKLYALQIIRNSHLDKFGATVVDSENPVVATVGLTGVGELQVALPDLKAGSYTFNLIEVAAQTIDINVGIDGQPAAPVIVGQ
ncbi:MAG: hypothetical protein RL196_1176 [Actinomycetota bacterium]|jgi:hypothetical protein